MESQCNAADAPNAVQINNGISAMAAPLPPFLLSLPVILYLIPKRILREYSPAAPPPMPKPDTLLLAGDNGSSPLI